jgi:hypothetical protein
MSLNRPPVFPWTDHSGTIAVAATAQQLMPINNNRTGILIQNQHATEVLWVRFQSVTGTDAAAAQPSIQIPAAGGILMIPEYADPGLVSVYAASAGHAFTAKEWGS